MRSATRQNRRVKIARWSWRFVNDFFSLPILKLYGYLDTRKKSYCAHLIKDCLSKDNAKRLDDVLGINQEEQKENQPPTKKLKVFFMGITFSLFGLNV